ncbi:MAG: nucleoside triphosphate pyrophosphohydrolase [Nitrospirales bacterium]
MSTQLSQLVTLMARLRAPDGCPWDRKQTHETLKPYLLEESYEALEAIDRQDPSALKEELGDVLLQVIFHAQIAEEHSEFTLEDVATHLSQKLIRRHPHVFEPHTQGKVSTASEIANNWEAIKRQERQSQRTHPSVLDGIPKTAPALHRAYQAQKRASKNGFDWTTVTPVFEKLREECQELCTATADLIEQQSNNSSPESLKAAQAQVEDEFGDVLFSFVNMSRFLKVNPEESLRQATNRFMTRFRYVELKVEESAQSFGQCSETDLEKWWEEAKTQERTFNEKQRQSS